MRKGELVSYFSIYKTLPTRIMYELAQVQDIRLVE